MNKVVRPLINSYNFSSNRIYIAKEGKGLIGVVGDNVLESFSKDLFIRSFEIICDIEENILNLNNTYVFTHYVNSEFEEQEALFDEMLNKVVMTGDYYHEKIGYIIDGFLDGVAYSGKNMIYRTLRIDSSNKNFKKLDFYSENNYDDCEECDFDKELECITNGIETGNFEKCGCDF